MRKAVFFDRDGVLNVDKSYLGFIKDFEWMDGAKEALAYLTAEGYAIIVVTNQSGVARGYYTEDAPRLDVPRSRRCRRDDYRRLLLPLPRRSADKSL